MKSPIFLMILRLLAAIILVQTLFFKFTGHSDSVYIFTTVGMEPWGRYLIGTFELIASILLFIPRLAWLGAGIGCGVMAGAIFFHLTILGISVQGDGGKLFAMGLIVLVCCLLLLWNDRRNVPVLGKMFS